MNDKFVLKPSEAAHMAANVYFTLEGWEATYKFKEKFGQKTPGAPKPTPGLAPKAIVDKHVVGAGPTSIKKTGINNGKVIESFIGSTGSNLLGRTRSGFGYILSFERNNANHLVIATRGTRPEMGYPDLLTDANASSNRNMPGVGPVHSGFYDTYQSIRPILMNIQNLVLAADVVHCVGHSLGGAVANLVALDLAMLGANVRLYTFGAPRVGLRPAMYDNRARRIIGENNIYRVSHNFDPIPMIPVAPYIHVLPSVKDNNNIFIGSPLQKITLENHDTANYISSVKDKSWSEMRTDKLLEGYLDKQYFLSWRSSESWLKRYLGQVANAAMATLQRVLQGLIDTVGVGVVEIATILDLLAIAIRRGLDSFKVGKNHIIKFINDCARMFGVGVDVSKDVLSKLFRKLMAELRIATKMAIKRASSLTKSTEFSVILSMTAASSIGLLLI